MNFLPINTNGSPVCHCRSFSNTGLNNEMKNELLAKKIEARMKERGLSRQEFAKLMDVQPSIITRWLSGRHNFTLETIYEIERTLDLQIIDLDSSSRTTDIIINLLVDSSHTHWRNPTELIRPFGALFGSQTAANPSINVIRNYDSIEQSLLEDNDHLQDEINMFIGRKAGL